MDERQYQFEWDEIKASANISKHGVSFELAATVFADPGLLTIADPKHDYDRRAVFSVGLAGDGKLLSLAACV